MTLQCLKWDLKIVNSSFLGGKKSEDPATLYLNCGVALPLHEVL